MGSIIPAGLVDENCLLVGLRARENCRIGSAPEDERELIRVPCSPESCSAEWSKNSLYAASTRPRREEGRETHARGEEDERWKVCRLKFDASMKRRSRAENALKIGMEPIRHQAIRSSKFVHIIGAIHFLHFPRFLSWPHF